MFSVFTEAFVSNFFQQQGKGNVPAGVQQNALVAPTLKGGVGKHSTEGQRKERKEGNLPLP